MSVEVLLSVDATLQLIGELSKLMIGADWLELTHLPENSKMSNAK